MLLLLLLRTILVVLLCCCCCRHYLWCYCVLVVEDIIDGADVLLLFKILLVMLYCVVVVEGIIGGSVVLLLFNILLVVMLCCRFSPCLQQTQRDWNWNCSRLLQSCENVLTVFLIVGVVLYSYLKWQNF